MGVRPRDVQASQRGRAPVPQAQRLPPHLLQIREARRHVHRIHLLCSDRRWLAVVLTGPRTKTICIIDHGTMLVRSKLCLPQTAECEPTRHPDMPLPMTDQEILALIDKRSEEHTSELQS